MTIYEVKDKTMMDLSKGFDIIAQKMSFIETVTASMSSRRGSL